MLLSDILTGCYTGNGIFSNFINPVWVNAIPDASELDLYFILNYGERTASPVLNHFVINGEISDDNLAKVSSIIYMRNKASWEHMYLDYISKYEPTYNTQFTETTTEQREVVGDNKGTVTNTANGSINTTDNRTDSSTSEVTSSGNGSSNTNNSTYGFNTTTAVPTDTSTNTSTTGATTNSTGTNTGSATGTQTTTNSSNDVSNTDYHNNEDSTITHSKQGNIGVTETSAMLKNDIALWDGWSFIDTICMDICETIALSIYD